MDNTIRGVYAELEALESKYVGRMTSRLYQAYRAALEEERQHRGSRNARKFKHSPQLAACYFACKWTLEHPVAPPSSWRAVSDMRTDALLGRALGEGLYQAAKDGQREDLYEQLNELAKTINAIDYSRDIAGAS